MLQVKMIGLWSCVAVVAADAAAADWNPATFREESVLEFFTVNRDGEEHWATVWFVELQGEVFVRLGERAATRIRENVNEPIVSVRIGDQRFDRMVAEEVRERAGDVVAGMQQKYWSARFSSWFSSTAPEDRLTLRLRPEAE